MSIFQPVQKGRLGVRGKADPKLTKEGIAKRNKECETIAKRLVSQLAKSQKKAAESQRNEVVDVEEGNASESNHSDDNKVKDSDYVDIAESSPDSPDPSDSDASSKPSKRTRRAVKLPPPRKLVTTARKTANKRPVKAKAAPKAAQKAAKATKPAPKTPKQKATDAADRTDQPNSLDDVFLADYNVVSSVTKTPRPGSVKTPRPDSLKTPASGSLTPIGDRRSSVNERAPRTVETEYKNRMRAAPIDRYANFNFNFSVFEICCICQFLKF